MCTVEQPTYQTLCTLHMQTQTHKHAASIVVVYDTVSSDLELGRALARQENGHFMEFKDREEEQNGMWYINRTNVILASDSYIRLYIIYRGSPEDLRKDHPHAWEVMKQIRTRAYDSNRLKKVVFVQVASRTVSEGETRDETKILDDHTVGITESQLSSQQIASIIHSKVGLRKSHEKLNNMTRLRNVPPEETDEGMPAHQSPEGSPLPLSGGHYGQRTEDTAFLSLPSNPTSGLPPYTSQPASLSLSQARNVPIPQAAEESIPSNGSQKELISEVKKLTEKTGQVLSELQKHGKTHEDIRDNTRRTADNTGDVKEGMEEVRQITSETNDLLKRENFSEEQPDVS